MAKLTRASTALVEVVVWTGFAMTVMAQINAMRVVKNCILMLIVVVW